MEPWASVLALLALLAAGVSGVYAFSALAGLPGTLHVGSFLSGWRPQEHALSRYHVRWYAATMIFLAFDMEMVFMYPWSLVVVKVGASALVEMFLFLGLLMVGVVYAWREGAFRWA